MGSPSITVPSAALTASSPPASAPATADAAPLPPANSSAAAATPSGNKAAPAPAVCILRAALLLISSPDGLRRAQKLKREKRDKKKADELEQQRAVLAVEQVQSKPARGNKKATGILSPAKKDDNKRPNSAKVKPAKPEAKQKADGNRRDPPSKQPPISNAPEVKTPEDKVPINSQLVRLLACLCLLCFAYISSKHSPDSCLIQMPTGCVTW